MKKVRCNFENFIRKTSAFFVVFTLVISLIMMSGCGSAVRDYLEANNLIGPEEYADTDKKDIEETGDDEIAGASKEAAESEETGASEKAESSDTGDAQDDIQDSAKDSAEDSSDSSAQGSSYLDEDAINKTIDNIISQIEEETGRKRRQETVEDSQGAGEDATNYFSDTYQNNQRASIGLTDEGIEEIKKSQSGLYAFEHLNDEGQTLYAEILTIIQSRAEDIVVSTLDEEILDVVCQFVLADHPEIFYMDGYTYTRYTIGGELNKISFTGNYIYQGEEVVDRQTRIDSYVNTCLSGMGEDLDDYGKVKYIFDYLITNTDYDSTSPDNQNICSVFLYGKSVCQGYAKATQYLLNKIGIPATLVTGKVNGVGHAWNLVYIDGEYTYVDTTWGDSSYQRTESSDDTGKLPLINYAYLCCTTQDISRTHTISETLPMPKCESLRNNYYVRENEYFVTPDMDAVGALFSRRYADGSNNVTIKCSTYDVYRQIYKGLIDDQQVFGYLQGSNNTVSYTTFDDQYILIIWLY